MHLISDDAVLAECDLHHFGEGWQARPIRIWCVTGQRVAALIGAPGPDELDPPVDAHPRNIAGSAPALVISLAIPRKFDRPQSRCAVAIDDSDKRTRTGFRDTALHRWGKDVVRFTD